MRRAREGAAAAFSWGRTGAPAVCARHAPAQLQASGSPGCSWSGPSSGRGLPVAGPSRAFAATSVCEHPCTPDASMLALSMKSVHAQRAIRRCTDLQLTRNPGPKGDDRSGNVLSGTVAGKCFFYGLPGEVQWGHHGTSIDAVVLEGDCGGCHVYGGFRYVLVRTAASRTEAQSPDRSPALSAAVRQAEHMIRDAPVGDAGHSWVYHRG